MKSGYSSTVFKSKNGSDHVLAFRGTQLGNGADLVADGDILTDGLAMWQIVDMYNDIQRMRATAGTTYSIATLEYDMATTNRLSAAAHNLKASAA